MRGEWARPCYHKVNYCYENIMCPGGQKGVNDVQMVLRNLQYKLLADGLTRL